MGMAWHKSAAYPWETARYVSGIEVIKVNITLRIYSAKWHVYAGLALLNPSAQTQIRQYATSTTELFKLMVEGKEAELSERVWSARRDVFGWQRGEEAGASAGVGVGAETSRESKGRSPILLSEDVLDQFSLGQAPTTKAELAPNSHLSLLAMVDCWAKLGIRPFEHLDVAGTPVFMLWIGTSHSPLSIAKDITSSTSESPIYISSLNSIILHKLPALLDLTMRCCGGAGADYLSLGVAEYLFRSPTLVQSAITASLNDKIHRPDDIEFVLAARGWSECVTFGNFDLYHRRFQETAGKLHFSSLLILSIGCAVSVRAD